MSILSGKYEWISKYLQNDLFFLECTSWGTMSVVMEYLISKQCGDDSTKSLSISNDEMEADRQVMSISLARVSNWFTSLSNPFFFLFIF